MAEIKVMEFIYILVNLYLLILLFHMLVIISYLF